MSNGVSIHLGRFQRLSMLLADDNPALIALGLVLARIEDGTGRIALDEAEVATVCECSLGEATLALERLVAAGAVYTVDRPQADDVPSDPNGTPATTIFINPHVAFRGSFDAHEAALQRVAPPGSSLH